MKKDRFFLLGMAWADPFFELLFKWLLKIRDDDTIYH